MLPSRWFKILRSLGLEFWLPLPLLGLAVWVGCGLIMDGVLSRSHQATEYLKVDPKLAKQPKIDVLLILAKINKRQGISRVYVKTGSPTLKKLEFEFPVKEFNQVEAAISQELGLQREDVRKLIRYQIDESNNIHVSSTLTHPTEKHSGNNN